MLYRNVITGAEFKSSSNISAPDWICVGAEVPLKDPVEAKEPAEKAEPPKEEKKPAPKKNTKRIRK